MERQSPSAEGELTEEKPVNVHAHSRDSWAHEATLPMPWVRFGERRCTSLAQTLFDGKTHTLQGTDLARQR